MFQVGDMVWCKVNHKYTITNYHIPCVVVSVFNNELYVTTASNPRGKHFEVDASLFELMKVDNWKAKLMEG